MKEIAAHADERTDVRNEAVRAIRAGERLSVSGLARQIAYDEKRGFVDVGKTFGTLGGREDVAGALNRWIEKHAPEQKLALIRPDGSVYCALAYEDGVFSVHIPPLLRDGSDLHSPRLPKARGRAPSALASDTTNLPGAGALAGGGGSHHPSPGKPVR